MSTRMRWLRALAPPLITFILLHVLWQIAVRALHVPPWKLPAPSDIISVAWQRLGSLCMATLVTASSALIGFALSAAIGIAVGIALSSTRLVERAFYPFTVFLQTVPLVAIAPILVIWVGNGPPAVTVLAFIVSVFPVIANTLAGMRAVDPALRDLFSLYGASPVARLARLKLPSALPEIFTGLRIAAGLAVIGAVVGEFTAGSFEPQGLGIVVLSAARQLQTDWLFAAVAAASLLGLGLFALVGLASHLALRRWHASAKD